jgi:hypothetical protein
MLDTDEFSVEATLAIVPPATEGVVIKGLFDNGYLQASVLGVGIESREPSFEAKDSNITGLDHGDTLTIAGVVYNIIRIEPDGTGMTKLYLSKD